jgi:hypothetical protein
MPIKYVSQDQFIIESLVKMVSTLGDGSASENRRYNSTIGFGLDEVVRQNLRRIAQSQKLVGSWDDMLEDAIQESAEQLRREIDSHGLRFDAEPYLRNTRNSLASAAKEIVGLNRKLIESKERKRIAEKTPVTTTDNRRQYEVSELGLLDSVEGLLATPTVGVTSLNIEKMQETFLCEGKWFPFEVRVDDLLFIVDDDGAIFVSTENFPNEALERAKGVLHRLAQILYS